MRVRLFGFPYNLRNSPRWLALSPGTAPWSPTALRETLIKTGIWLIRGAQRLVSQMAEVTVALVSFEQTILRTGPVTDAPEMHARFCGRGRGFLPVMQA